ncbi:MAG: right-handed parallel beta-helix repeat-containing protein [Balneolaceae bacterium]|nr:right-handed parallel beta-helix repeat-containing protein [Balneolaceae bacterium]
MKIVMFFWIAFLFTADSILIAEKSFESSLSQTENYKSGDIRNYGAVGDGVTDDTEAIRRAVEESGGAILISSGRYRITETIEVTMLSTGRVGINGDSGTGSVIMAGAGPAFRIIGSHQGTSNPDSVTEDVWIYERMPVVENLEIKGGHPEADGLEFIDTMQPVVRGVLIRDVRHGILVRERSRNFILDSSHIYNCSGSGLFFDRVNIHQANVLGSHISFCKKGGIKSVGSEIRNLQITGNDIEYNYDQEADESADIWIDVREGTVREGTISSNTIQSVPSPGGANIRFIGADDSYDETGLWSITGNHISNAYKNIYITGGRGFTITGNSFIRGIDRNLVVENSRNIVFSSNSIDNNPDYQEDAGNGITIRNSKGVLLTGLQMDIAGPAEHRAGALEILNSSEVSVTACQIFYPDPTGIYIEDSRNIQIEQCMIQKKDDQPGMTASIRITGSSEQVFIRNNLVTSGSEGDIISLPSTVMIEGNQNID